MSSPTPRDKQPSPLAGSHSQSSTPESSSPPSPRHKRGNSPPQPQSLNKKASRDNSREQSPQTSPTTCSPPPSPRPGPPVVGAEANNLNVISNPNPNLPTSQPTSSEIALIGEYEVYLKLHLGKGAFSNVYEGMHTRSKEKIAVKIIKAADTAAAVQNEIKINRISMGHPNIVNFFSHVYFQNNHYLIFELCERGEVFSHIIPNNGLSQRELIGSYYSQLIDAVAHIHARGVCHLDIKTENMFVDIHGRVKLGDFGLSTLLEDGPVLGARGSLSYASPENVREHYASTAMNKSMALPYDGQKADIWSCGIVLFVMLYGYTPWDEARDNNLDFRLYKSTDGYPNMKPWNRLSATLRTFFQRTLAVRPNRRWCATAMKQFISKDMGWSSEFL